MTTIILELLPLTGFRWYRRLVGGKWSRWSVWILYGDIWIRGWDRPGCAAYCHDKENWTK